MTHEQIDEQHVAERYVLGKLPPEELLRFEEHMVDCPRCLDRIETTERLRTALKPVAAAEASRKSPRWFGSLSWPQAALLAAAVLLAMVLPVVLALRNVSLRRELDASKAAAPAPVQPAPFAAATFVLSATRGAEADTSAPPSLITLPTDSGWIILSLDREPEPEFSSLRASLTDSAGHSVWQQNALRSTAGQSLSLALPSMLLHSGDYTLAVEGFTADGRTHPAGRYRFRVATP